MQVKDKILTALVQGPVATTRWAEFSASRKSFHVHIVALRRAGYDIETKVVWAGRKQVNQYELKDDITLKCRCCGQIIQGVE